MFVCIIYYSQAASDTDCDCNLDSAWIDINLTVTPHTLPIFFRLISDPFLQIRLAVTQVLLRIVQKGLKQPSDKLNLIRVLSLGEVLQNLEENTRSKTTGEEMSDDDVSYREGLGRLTSGLGQELVKLCEEVRNFAQTTQSLPLTHPVLSDQHCRRDSSSLRTITGPTPSCDAPLPC